MDTVGAYAFATSDWKDLNFPLDLWMQWNSRFFDQIALVKYGDFTIETPSNVIVKVMDEVPRKDFNFYTIGKTEAQHLLSTDWKLALDIDEFLNQKIDTSRLDRRKTYAIKMRNLYGNPLTEIINDMFPSFYFRLSYGDRPFKGDGGDLIHSEWKNRKKFESYIRFGKRKLGIQNKPHYLTTKPYECCEVWHTGTLREPAAMSKKWKEQTEREVNVGITTNEKRLEILDRPFDYHSFRELGNRVYLRKVSPEEIPEIILANSDRFWKTDFMEDEYESMYS
ncbi:MAG: hypothetical protein M1496_04655 [Candidatus Thermoplasmatota archaeon]|nr:hypothetical protein [Candidatus Thermoplasmatota archaeon]